MLTVYKASAGSGKTFYPEKHKYQSMGEKNTHHKQANDHNSCQMQAILVPEPVPKGKKKEDGSNTEWIISQEEIGMVYEGKY